MPLLRTSLGDGPGTLAPGGSPSGGEYYGAGGRWVNVAGCFFGAPEDWPGFQRAYLCSSPYTTCSVPCPSDTCGGGNASACPGYVAPQTPVNQVVNPTAPAPAAKPSTDTAGKSLTSPKITVETSEGPIEVPAEFVPGVSDGALTPARIHIPNIWDSLDPSKVSQFEYRGLATSLPSWVSDRWRQTLAAALGPVTPGSDIPGGGGAPSPVNGEIPVWVWAVIGAAAWAMSENRARTTSHRRKVAA